MGAGEQIAVFPLWKMVVGGMVGVAGPLMLENRQLFPKIKKNRKDYFSACMWVSAGFATVGLAVLQKSCHFFLS